MTWLMTRDEARAYVVGLVAERRRDMRHPRAQPTQHIGPKGTSVPKGVWSGG